MSGEARGSILREIIERVGILPWLQERLLTAVLLLAMGWRDRNDADALRNDPVMRLIVSTVASS